ncbi:MAG TPA: hypothetical protein VHW44_24725 [Pseudonocardiaceae bacterium]|jgi:predicted lipoprotein with Yx(FWY)xxD motif|nr:hypothetical protein [Pseudonocardiaceae bacterium]
MLGSTLRKIGFGAPLVAVAALVAACGSGTSASSAGAASTTPPAGAPAGSAVTVEAHSGDLGMFLTDQNGKSLYLFASDTSTTSTCSGSCASVWPPLTTTGPTTASGGAIGGELGMIVRPDGTKQVTYAGHPLYYFAEDGAAGQTKGEGINGFGALWWLVQPGGAELTTASPATGSTPSPAGAGANAGGGWS